MNGLELWPGSEKRENNRKEKSTGSFIFQKQKKFEMKIKEMISFEKDNLKKK